MQTMQTMDGRDKTFSTFLRKTYRQKLQQTTWDVLVIGGGITGAGIALDAQSRGMQTALLEMQDFAAGTSSRSTKLVHGGLRYLKQLDVKLVAEVGKERAIVYENGPHVTTPEWMLLPIYKGGTFGKFTTSLALRVYDFLAGVKREERRQMLNAEETLRRLPLLKQEGLKGGGYYVEYRTDDARLTIEVMKKAVEYGATALNYSRVDGFLYENGRVCGVKVTDLPSGETYEVRATKIINAAGPWVDELRELDGSKKGKTLHLTKGVHLVIDKKRLPLEQAVYFDTPDGRMVFAIPRGNKTYVGTTDTNYNADIAKPRMTEEDRDYLIDCVNGIFPEVRLTKDDIESSWAGLRPLIHQEGKDPSQISRRDEIFESGSGLLSMAGGKLTGYRKMAEVVVDRIAADLSVVTGKQYSPCQTKNIPISGGEVGGSRNYASFVQSQIEHGQSIGLKADEAEKIARLYGMNSEIVFQMIMTYQEAANNGGEPDALAASALNSAALQEAAAHLPMSIRAMIDYAVKYELAASPVDFFIRRTGTLLFDIDWVHRWKQPVVNYMAALLGWSAEERAKYEAELQEELHYAVHPES